MDGNTNEHTQQPQDHRFAIGLLTGTVVGAWLAIWLAPKSRAVRHRVAGAVARGAHRMADAAREVELGAHEVAQNARDVERFATARR